MRSVGRRICREEKLAGPEFGSHWQRQGLECKGVGMKSCVDSVGSLGCRAVGVAVRGAVGSAGLHSEQSTLVGVCEVQGSELRGVGGAGSEEFETYE